MKKVFAALAVIICLLFIILSFHVCRVFDYKSRPENKTFSEISFGVEKDRTTISINSDSGESYYDILSKPDYESLGFFKAVSFLFRADKYESLYFTLRKPGDGVERELYLVTCEAVFMEDGVYLYCLYSGNDGMSTTVYKSDSPVSYAKSDVKDCTVFRGLVHDSCMSLLKSLKNNVVILVFVVIGAVGILFFVHKLKKCQTEQTLDRFRGCDDT